MSKQDPSLKGAQPPADCADCGLRATGAFLPVTDEQLRYIQGFRKSTRAIGRGQPIIIERKMPPDLFTLYSGWAFRYKTLTDGRRQILNFLLPGDFIGLQGEFVDDATYGVEALTAVTLCVFQRDKLWELFHEQPRLAYEVTWLNASEEQMLDENLLTLGRRNASERIAMLLIHLWRRAERVKLTDKDGSIEFPLTQQHIADALGLSLVHTNKSLRKLERIGLHTLQAGRLRIKDPAALQELADYHLKRMRANPLI